VQKKLVAQQRVLGLLEPWRKSRWHEIAPWSAGNAHSGRGLMAFTVLGSDHYPSAGYAGIDSIIGIGDIHIAAEGLGADDGFTGYKPTASNGTRPRWGDYGAAASDGNSIWIASEYVNQTCTFNTWLSTNFRCGNTRTQLANWGTRISKVVP